MLVVLTGRGDFSDRQGKSGLAVKWKNLLPIAGNDGLIKDPRLLYGTIILIPIGKD